MKTRTWILGAKAVRAWALGLATILATAPAVGAGGYVPPGSDTSSLPANISSDLAELTATLLPDTPVRVIVGSNGPMSVADRLRLQTLITSWGGTYDDDFDSYDGYVADCPADRVDDLARDAKTFHVAPDRTVRASMDVAL